MEFLSSQSIRQFFSDAVEQVFNHDFGLNGQQQIKSYMTDLMIKFVGSEASIAPRNWLGVPVLRLTDLLEEGDVMANASSFERERRVHQHIGDHLLFWTGLFPKGHQVIHIGSDRLIDPIEQGRFSYEIVSLFDLPPHEEEAPMFRELSENFETYQVGLRQISQRLWAA